MNCSNMNSIMPLLILLLLMGCFNQGSGNNCCCGDAGLFNAGGGCC